MPQTTVKSFAAQIGVPSDKLLQQLIAAGIDGKNTEDALSDDEKLALLTFLRSHHGGEGSGTRKVVLRQKSTSQVKQSSRTGAARTVQVEVRKKRTFVKRSALDEQPSPEPEAVQPSPPEPVPDAAPILHATPASHPVVEAKTEPED